MTAAAAQRPGLLQVPWHRKRNLAYEPTIPGRYFREAPQTLKLYGGAVGGSKTTSLSCEAIRLSLKYPNNRGFVGERDFDDLRRGCYGEILEWLPQDDVTMATGQPFCQHHKSEHWLRFYNGSEIHFVELKDEPRNVNLGWAIIDQAERVPPVSYDWMMTRLRLPVPYRPLMLSANPEPCWVKTDFVDGAEPVHTGVRRLNGEELVVYGKGSKLFVPAFVEDNPHLPDGYVEQLYQMRSAHLVERLLKGVWDVVENAIYPQLDRAKHLLELPDSVRWGIGALGVDYGRRHLSAVVAVQRDDKGRYWVRECWAEAGGGPEPIKDAASAMKVRYGIQRGRIDPTRDEFMAQGLGGFKIAKGHAGSRKQRIDLVTRLIEADALFFDLRGVGVRECFEEAMAYRYETRESDYIAEDVVVRKDDDRVAAMEYAIEELMEGAEPFGMVGTSVAPRYVPRGTPRQQRGVSIGG